MAIQTSWVYLLFIASLWDIECACKVPTSINDGPTIVSTWDTANNALYACYVKYVQSPELISLKSLVHSWIRFGTRFSKIKCIKSYGNDHGNRTDWMKWRTGAPFTPYSFARRSASALVDACCTCIPISRISSCCQRGKSAALYLATVASAGPWITSGCCRQSRGT